MEIKKATRTLELCDLYNLYNLELAKNFRYDYEDMINWVNNAFRNDPDLALIYQEKYQYILVDEYQDTNNTQLELLGRLTNFYKDNPNLFVVGDPNQSIYRFQGASNYNIEQFTHNYPKATKIELTTNYRSGQGIINAGISLIGNNNITSVQISNTKIPTRVELITYLHNEQEIFDIAQKIKALIKDQVKPSDCAILVRRNDQISDFVTALGAEKIPFQIIKGDTVLKSPFVEKILLLADVLVDPSNPVVF